MKQMLLNLSALCMFASLFDQLMQRRTALPALRMVLGLEVFRILFILLREIVSKII